MVIFHHAGLPLCSLGKKPKLCCAAPTAELPVPPRAGCEGEVFTLSIQWGAAGKVFTDASEFNGIMDLPPLLTYSASNEGREGNSLGMWDL